MTVVKQEGDEGDEREGAFLMALEVLGNLDAVGSLIPSRPCAIKSARNHIRSKTRFMRLLRMYTRYSTVQLAYLLAARSQFADKACFDNLYDESMQ